LFQSFPLGDKSSVNLRGNFHVENVTTFEENVKSSTPDDSEMQIDSDQPAGTQDTLKGKPESYSLNIEETASKDSLASSIDALYPVFWALQHSFSNPPRLFEGDNFKEFQKGLETTLAVFKEVPTVIQTSESTLSSETQSKTEENDNEFASAFNPKYLTSRDLFKLEVSAFTATHN
jgi:THO complex subunit 1